MTIPNESKRLERFIHEIIHEIADNKEVLEYTMNIKSEEARNGLRDLVAVIINKWEDYKEQYIQLLSKDDNNP